jgi:hypothetical protein
MNELERLIRSQKFRFHLTSSPSKGDFQFESVRSPALSFLGRRPMAAHSGAAQSIRTTANKMRMGGLSREAAGMRRR